MNVTIFLLRCRSAVYSWAIMAKTTKPPAPTTRPSPAEAAQQRVRDTVQPPKPAGQGPRPQGGKGQKSDK